MNWRWLNPFVSNLWAWLTGGLVFWGAANGYAFYKFAAMIAPYRNTGTAPAAEQVIAEFGKAVAVNSVGLGGTSGRIRSLASVVDDAGNTGSDAQGPLIRAYLQNSENETRAVDYRRIAGAGTSPAVLTCLIANAATDTIDATDLEASQAAMETLRRDPQASFAELREVLSHMATAHGRARETQLIYEIAFSLGSLPEMQTAENQRALEEMTALLHRN